MNNTSKAKEQWNAVIAEKLKEGVTIEDLHHQYAEGISMEPNVMASDISGYDHTLTVDRHWSNMATIEGGDSESMNAAALQALQHGANGLNIILKDSDSISTILKDVMTAYLDVRIDCSALSKDQVESQKVSLNDGDYPNITWIGAHGDSRQLSVTQEGRVASIKNCVEKLPVDIPTDIVVNIGKNLLFEVASLRALRALLEKKNSSIRIIVDYKVEGTNELGDYNLIEKTYKVLSGIMGCADAILTPYNGDEESRLTLNIHNVLDLESGMKNVLDPLSGSYYIEKLTGEIIRQVNS